MIANLPTEADLQMLFARLNLAHFDGEIAASVISYNERFTNCAGRTTYRTPALIELSPKHFRRYPEALEETLLHEMIHVWCYQRFGETGHGRHFRQAMKRCGVESIHHDLGTVRPLQEASTRYIFRCEHCGMEALRRRLPSRSLTCGRCNPRRHDARFPLMVFEVVEMRPIGEAGRIAPKRAASRTRQAT
ncbi:MAG TPA: SprT family zinc-dependent metalloprotease [Candidatus Dormibacteraeota bacterium]|nr:SprT family zinc-dependent metalloprotease [Candidatus Dormibacteraeota bacterium]